MKIRLLQGKHGPIWLINGQKIAPVGRPDGTGRIRLRSGVHVRIKR